MLIIIFQTPDEFLLEYENRTSVGEYGALDMGPFGYDSAWVLAFALNKSIEILAESGKALEDFTYDRADIADVIFKSVGNLKFLGVTVKSFPFKMLIWSIGREKTINICSLLSAIEICLEFQSLDTPT